jgi:uncharacterized protein (TIGR02271 family)
MALYKLEEFAANYKDADFGNYDIYDFDVYSDINDDRIGSIKHILVDDSGRFRYLVVDTGFWIFGKKVLLPIGRAQISYSARRVYAQGLTREQVENLPDFDELERVDYDYEERVRGVYRTPTTAVPVDTSATRGDRTRTAYDRNTYSYEYEPDLYTTTEPEHQNLKLYEERLVADKSRVKTGEVGIGKRVETEKAQVAVPIEKEQVVIERTTPADAGRIASPGEADFRNQQVARMDVYEETPDIRKEAVVREEVKVKKVVDQDTVEAQETLRREELDINQNDPNIRETRR